MSFLGVKVILFLVIPLIIKEKSNASALRTVDTRVYIDRYEHVERSMRHDFLNGFTRFLNGFTRLSQWFCATKG